MPIEDLPAGPRGRIIRVAEAKAWQDGYGLLDAAQREASELREAARRAYAVEYAQGYRDGAAAGKAEAARIVSETVAKVDRYLGSLEGEVMNLALDVARRVLGEMEIGMVVGRAARQAIAELRRAKYVKVSVHPGSAMAVRDQLDAYLRESDIGLTVEITVDKSLAPDACTLATEVAVIEAGIEAQLSALAAALTAEHGPR